MMGAVRIASVLLFFSGLTGSAVSANASYELLALSEIKREELPPPGGAVTTPALPGGPTTEIPSPEPIKPASPLDDVAPVDEQVDPDAGEDADPARSNVDPNAPLPVVEYDLTKLPDAVREKHKQIVDAATTGKIENLRALIGSGQDVTQFALSGEQDDPLAYLLSLSGDEGGQEILAILLEILDAGYVHIDAGTPQDLYVWPYFFAIPLDKLTEMQRVELFKIVTSGDVEDMKTFGSYIFYRAGISPDGKWRFFLAGE